VITPATDFIIQRKCSNIFVRLYLPYFTHLFTK